MEPVAARLEQLDAATIAAALGPRAGEIEIGVISSCGSTNTLLLERADCDLPVLLAADHQSAGRGRHGRRWHAAPGAGISFSLRRRMRRALRELAGASLAAGVAVARALRAAGAPGIALKWPNDLLAPGGAKLGGILIETRVQDRSAVAVIGIGVNYRSAPDSRVRRRTAALEEVLRPLPPRNVLIGRIACELLDVLDSFDASGLAVLREEWESLHAHAGQRIRLRLADGSVVSGIHTGVAEDGAMCVRTRNGVRALHSARVLSARPA
jgi:BirA family transcriptional regulator, biotin operon repressor / biotin---[acetyl-CoA-carboxylase] ligase